MKPFIFALLFISLITNTFAKNGKATIDISKRMDPEISHVHSGGFWSLGDQNGIFRIIAYTGGFDHIRSVVHLQWLNMDPKMNKLTVHKTVNIKECEKLVGFVITSIALERIGNLNYAVIKYNTKKYIGENKDRSTIKWKNATMKLKLSSPGVYTKE